MLHALTNIAGESVSGAGQFISGEHIGKCINPALKNPFREGVIYVGSKDDLLYQDFCDLSRVLPEDLSAPWYIHIDASLGSDGNSISGGRILYAQEQRTELGLVQPELHYRQLFKVKVRAPKGDKTMLRKNEQFIYWLRQQGINIAAVSSDQYQSKAMGQDFVAAGLNYIEQSIDRVVNHVNPTYSVLRPAIYEHRVELLDDEDQTTELLHLVRYEDGRVDKGLGYHDDASQCLCGWVYLASKDKEKFVLNNVVIGETTIGTTGLDTKLEDESLLPKELVLTEAELLNEFGAFKTDEFSGLRNQYDRAFGSTRKREEQVVPKSSPFNFF